MNKKKRKTLSHYFVLLAAALMLIFSSCSKKKEHHEYESEHVQIQSNKHTIGIHAHSLNKQKTVSTKPSFQSIMHNSSNLSSLNTIKETSRTKAKKGILSPDRLDFIVENKTGKTIYVCCFAYMRKRPLSRWSWRKSSIYKVTDKASVVVHIPKIREADDRKNTFGILGVFESDQEAENSTYELLPDEDKIDLDLLEALQGKKVTIEIEKYGFKKPFYDYDFVKINGEQTQLPSLNFFVKNETGKPIYVTGFIYMKKAKGRWVAAIDSKDDMTVWRFDKTNILRLEPNQTNSIEIDTNDDQRDREYMLAFLGVFTEHEQILAEQSTYELIAPENKLHLGPLKDVAGKTIALEVEQYGVAGDLIDYVVKEPHQIDFTKVAR